MAGVGSMTEAAVDLDIDLRAQGRPRRPLRIEYVRDVEEADLAMAQSARGYEVPVLKKIRDSHHALARSLAMGFSDIEAGVAAGYSASSVSRLKADPAFRELMAHYASEVRAAYTDFNERLSLLGLDSLGELHDRVRETPEEFSHPMLLDIVKATADRTGHGPSAKQTNVNYNFDLAGRIERGDRRVEERATERMLLVGTVKQGPIQETRSDPHDCSTVPAPSAEGTHR